MLKEIIINKDEYETRAALMENKVLAELFIERRGERYVLGNIYKGRVNSILPGMQAAFIDIGLDRNAFLHVSDVAHHLEEYEEFIRKYPRSKLHREAGYQIEECRARLSGRKNGQTEEHTALADQTLKPPSAVPEKADKIQPETSDQQELVAARRIEPAAEEKQQPKVLPGRNSSLCFVPRAFTWA